MNLQGLCIEVIVKEFERFFLVYCNTDDVHLKRKFEFLQRKYSHEIVFQLGALDMMQPKYIDLLVNKYLKVLDTKWFKNVPWETVAAKFAEIGSNIQKISFQKCGAETPWQNIIHHLINLEDMEFDSNCTDEILKCVAQFCHNIVEIDVSDSISVTNEGIKYLCLKENKKPLCPKLKRLSCADSDVSEEGVEYLIKNLRSLEEIDYQDLPDVLYSLHKNDLSSLDKVEPYNLTSLDLLHLNSLPYYTDLLKICLALCPNLKSLYCTIRNEEHLNLISGPSEVEVLHIECNRNFELDITDFVKLNGRNLKSFSVSDCTLPISILPESCPDLKELILNQVILKNDSDIISTFHHLKVCVFENNMLYRQCTAAESVSLILKYSPKLEEIIFKRYDLSSTALKTAILKCCENCPINRVMFISSTIDLKFAKDILMNCHTLELLKITACNLEIYEEVQLYRFAQFLPNCPDVDFEDYFSLSNVGEEYMNALGIHDDDYGLEYFGDDSDYGDEDDDYDYDGDYYDDEDI